MNYQSEEIVKICVDDSSTKQKLLLQRTPTDENIIFRPPFALPMAKLILNEDVSTNSAETEISFCAWLNREALDGLATEFPVFELNFGQPLLATPSSRFAVLVVLINLAPQMVTVSLPVLPLLAWSYINNIQPGAK